MRQAVEIAQDIWALVKQEISCACPFLGPACDAVTILEEKEAFIPGTDIKHIFYSPDWLLTYYSKKGRQALNRCYLHMLFHCLYLQPVDREERKMPLWNLACDLVVEYTIDYLKLPWLVGEIKEEKEQVYRCFWREGKARSAEGIYEELRQKDYKSEDLKRLGELFLADSHTFWKDIRDDGLEEICLQWKKIIACAGGQGGRGGKLRGTQAGTKQEWYEILQQRQYDYRRFLRRFMVEREEVQLDMGSFDYIPYFLGLERYGNMPLVEPLEYTETSKLEEMVIAIDTSSSCSRETVQRFLEETYSILSGRENFFKKMNVHILQCDCYIQEHVQLTCEEEWKRYMRYVKIQGRGGTDFRPVFSFTEQLIRENKIKNLKGLIYFTDGDGIFPTVKPSYQAAFVFTREPPEQVRIPSWVIRLYLDERGERK